MGNHPGYNRIKLPGSKGWLGLELALCLLLAVWTFPVRVESPASAAAGEADRAVSSREAAAAQPAASPNKALRLGYVEGEAYHEFDEALYYLLLGMEEYGLVPSFVGEPPAGVSSRELWTWLGKQDQSGWRVQFVEEGFFALDAPPFAQWGEEEAEEALGKELADKGIELVLTMGTTAGLAVRQLDIPVPMMNFCSADPVKSGIVGAAGASGIPNVWAQTDPDAFSRSIRVMDDILGPKKAGVVYADNQEAYIYSGVDVLDRLADELGYAVVREYVEDPASGAPENMQLYYEQLTRAYGKLAQEVDVFILTTSLINLEDMAQLLQPFYDHQVPVYSINAAEDVRYGALLGAQSTDYKNVGRFGADMLGRYLAGEKLEQLPQMYQTAPYLVINYGVAQKIGYRPSFAMLLSADRIYP
ncbi:MAG: putative transporter substrate binding protein [Paenibacillaceae bacterium]|jgi:ABC-type uncharacterized transport system substrate-binding protein|nr:putative transporter substrate binding protein [Paenibacillaceae bacterium]